MTKNKKGDHVKFIKQNKTNNLAEKIEPAVDNTNQTTVDSTDTNNQKKNNNIENILLNMKIISEIKESDKLLTNNDCLEIDTRYIQFVQRWWHEDGREITLIKIGDIIDSLFTYIDSNYGNNIDLKNRSNFEEDNTHLFQRIHRILLNSIRGLENLKTTYKNDIKTISQIDLMIEKINIRVERMSSKVKLV